MVDNTVCHEVLREINLCRSNPSLYAEHVASLLKYFKGNEIHKPNQIPYLTTEGPSAVQECVKRLRSLSALNSIELSEGMSKAAQDHCDDIGPHGATGHVGMDGSDLESRLAKYGEWDITIGENIDFGNNNGRDIVIALLIDDAVPSRGHRENILKSEYKVAGIGYGTHTEYNHMCTIDFAGAFLESNGDRSRPVNKMNPQYPLSKNPKLIHQILEELNLVRSNPASYSEHLASFLQYYRGEELHKPGEDPILTIEGPAAVEDCIEALRSTSYLPSLQLSVGLSKAAQDHCDDIGPNGGSGHDGTNGSTLDSRMEPYGEWDITVGENIDFGNDKARDIVISLLIDDGVSTRGHRLNILNPHYQVVGIGFGVHSEYNHMCVIDFAGAFNEKGSTNNQDQTNLRAALTSEDLPEGVVSVKTSQETTIKNGRKTIKKTQHLTYRDGSTETIETIIEQ